MEACGMSFIKYILFLFNLIFAASGLAILIVGSVVISKVSEYNKYLDGGVVGPPITLIVVGLIIFVIAFLGCCGAIKENYYMLMAFAGLLLVIFIVELAVGITAGVAKDAFTDAMRTELKASMANYTTVEVERQTWDKLQTNMKCCGMNNPRGWSSVLGENTVPASCCPGNNGTGTPPTCPLTSSTYQSGCYDKIKVMVKDNVVIIMGVAIGMAFIELAGIVLACCLASSIKKEQEAKKAAVIKIWSNLEEEGRLSRRRSRDSTATVTLPLPSDAT